MRAPVPTLQLALCVCMGVLGPSAQGATLVVDDPGDDPTSPACTLRHAVASANQDTPHGGCAAGDGADRIEFAAGLGEVLTLQQGELLLQGPLRIEGPGAAWLALDAGGRSRHLRIDSGEVAVSGLTLRNGRAPQGGAILLDGAARFEATDLVLRANRASGDAGLDAAGGGLFAREVPWILLEDLRFEDNIAGEEGDDGLPGRGGALALRGPDLQAVARRTLFRGNQALSALDAESVRPAHGGAIHLAQQAHLSLEHSALDRNRARPAPLPAPGGEGGDVRGGAIAVDDARLQIVSSALHGNVARAQPFLGLGRGGAIFSQGDLSVLRLDFASLVGNDANRGGALSLDGGDVLMLGSILSANPDLAAQGSVEVQRGRYGSLGGNVLAPADPMPVPFAPGPPDAFAADPRVFALHDLGRPSLYLAPRPGSAALGLVDHYDCTVFQDQRGVARAVPCDAGAWEGALAQVDLQVRLDDDRATAAPGDTLEYTLDLRNAGPDAATSVELTFGVSATLSLLGWQCEAAGSGVCPAAAGAGAPPSGFALAADSGLRFRIAAQVMPDATGSVSALAAAFPLGDGWDTSDGDNLMQDQTGIVLPPMFRDGFESP